MMRGRDYTLSGWLSVAICALVALGVGAGVGYAPRAAGGISGGGGGELTLIEKQDVSAVATITFSSLTGDTDGVYVVMVRGTGSAADLDLYIRFNSQAASDNNEGQRQDGGVDTDDTGNDAFMVSAGSAQEVLAGVAYIWGEKSIERVSRSLYASADAAAANASGGWAAGQWDETSTEMTSLQLVMSSGTITGTASLFKIENGD